MIGKTVGKYRIVEQLGRGGMGVVYKAIDESLDRPVAIKVFSAELEEDDVVKRFRKEATILARLNHPEIATIYELYRSDSDLLMVMEYVSGETLEKLSQRTGPLPPERAAYLVAEVLGALDHAHRAGVVHRDIKPANVMVSDQGYVKVMDFGIARVRGAAHTTLDGYMMGTPAYMAPEQVLGQEIDPRADLYSAGVVFYRLLTGALPFRSDTVVGMVQKVVSDQPIAARVHRAEIPEWCELVLARALAKRPADRFQTAEEFRQALLAPLNAVASERTLPPGFELTPRPAFTGAVGVTTPSVPATAPTGTAGPSMVSVVLPFTATKIVLQRKHVALGGSLAAVLVIFVLIARQSGSSGVPPPGATDEAGTQPLLPTSAGTRATASRPVSVPAGTPASPREQIVVRPSTSGAAPSLGARDVVPVDVAPTSLPASGALGRTAPAAIAAPFTFQARALMKEGDKEKEHDAKVLLGNGMATVTVRLDRTTESVLATIPFGSLLSVSYSKSKQPLWTTPTGPKQVFRLDVALGIFRGDRHWLALRTTDSFVVLRIDADDVNGVVAALEERTGRAVERLGDKKDAK